MRPQNIRIGESYRHGTSPRYAYAKAVKIIWPKTGYENPHSYTIVKCEWTVGKDEPIGLIKYFRPYDLVKLEEPKWPEKRLKS